jgi:hypothetical protein
MRIISLDVGFMDDNYTFINQIDILGLNVYVPNVLGSFVYIYINNLGGNSLIAPDLPPNNIHDGRLYFRQNTQLYVPLRLTEVTNAYIYKSFQATVNIFYEYSQQVVSNKKQDTECT